MRDYLFHGLDPDGARAREITLPFEDDAAAILHALGPAFPHGCELWCRYRLLGRFCGPICGPGLATAAALVA
jgi:hypothetical protein